MKVPYLHYVAFVAHGKSPRKKWNLKLANAMKTDILKRELWLYEWRKLSRVCGKWICPCKSARKIKKCLTMVLHALVIYFHDGERLLNQLRFGSWLPESTAMGVILLVYTPQENYAYRKRFFQWELTKVGMISCIKVTFSTRHPSTSLLSSIYLSPSASGR